MIKDGLKNFRQFLLRGNVVDLAVAVVVGAAFNGVVQALVANIITPLIAAIGGQPNFSALTFSIHHSVFNYGVFFNALLSFVIIATVVYFLVVVPINRLTNLMYREPTDSPTMRHCPECLSDIPKEAKRCKFCTSEVKPERVSEPV